ncbi:hypothetical protein [Streptomyces griseosporeus]|uniref:hypothetical protein n=1 Tax=Streptomyces griseosporeus TaxID=1910 RepID=UPI00167F00C3|nr:hypothetical protein [Streptomyces griseosporeus]GHF84963.1 hypothetical protein GCM10018783_64070 [Streptomyces griseosporeus]
MSFGDPNNPYGQPPQQSAPGYGYPQQQPGGYGYPAAPPMQQPYGMPVGPSQMPGITRAAQIMLGVIALAHAAIAALYGYTLTIWDKTMEEAGVNGSADAERFADFGKGVVVFLLGLATVFALLGLVLLLQYGKGGNAVRVCSIVYGSFAILTGIVMIAAWGLGLVIIVVAILLIVFAAKRASADWFRRPRY